MIIKRTEEMETELQSIQKVSDVGYLTTRLRLAKRKNERKTEEAIVDRLKDIGLLKDEKGDEGSPFENLRSYVNRILQQDEDEH
jgi:hypothetical protein